MNIAQYVKCIQTEIIEKHYDEYIHVFHEYKHYLECRIKENAKDVEAICQLAAVYVELRYDTMVSINLMEELLLLTANELDTKEKARIYTNLAYFYEESGQKENHLRCLKEAVSLNTDFPNAYDALGRLYIEYEYDKNAIALFEKASTLSDKIKYKYNYGIALFHDGDICKAKMIFETLLTKVPDDRRILYAVGVCCFYCGDKEKAIAIADALQATESDDYITESELADLYFLCEEYTKHNEMYENEPYALDVSWLAPYFYALKVMQDYGELEKKFIEVIEEENRKIVEAQSKKLDETYTEVDKVAYILHLQMEKEAIIQAYYDIKDKDFKPQLKIKLWFMSGCYLIDCPRHQCVL